MGSNASTAVNDNGNEGKTVSAPDKIFDLPRLLDDEIRLRKLQTKFYRSLYEPVSSECRYSQFIEAPSFIKPDELIFLCDDNGIIQNINYNVKTKLSYSSHNMKGQFIGCIMSDFLSMLHSTHVFPAYKRASGMMRDTFDSRINQITDERPLVVFDSRRRPYFAETKIHTIYLDDISNKSHFTDKDPQYYFILTIRLSTVQKDPNYLYLAGINSLRSELVQFKETSNNVVVICIDFIQSTELLGEKGPFNLAILNKRFYECAESLILNQFYPYVNFHEIIGDCFVFVLNADWGCKINGYCASMALNFVNQLQNITKSFIGIRAGIAFGKLGNLYFLIILFRRYIYTYQL